MKQWNITFLKFLKPFKNITFLENFRNAWKNNALTTLTSLSLSVPLSRHPCTRKSKRNSLVWQKASVPIQIQSLNLCSSHRANNASFIRGDVVWPGKKLRSCWSTLWWPNCQKLLTRYNAIEKQNILRIEVAIGKVQYFDWQHALTKERFYVWIYKVLLSLSQVHRNHRPHSSLMITCLKLPCLWKFFSRIGRRREKTDIQPINIDAKMTMRQSKKKKKKEILLKRTNLKHCFHEHIPFLKALSCVI